MFRSGDFYQSKDFKSTLTNSVTFTASSYSTLIAQMTICLYSDGRIMVTLKPTPLHFKELSSLGAKYLVPEASLVPSNINYIFESTDSYLISIPNEKSKTRVVQKLTQDKHLSDKEAFIYLHYMEDNTLRLITLQKGKEKYSENITANKGKSIQTIMDSITSPKIAEKRIAHIIGYLVMPLTMDDIYYITSHTSHFRPTLQNLEDLFKKINHEHENSPIDTDLFFECRQISEFIYKKKQYRHIISKSSVASSYVNPYLKEPDILHHLFDGRLKERNVKEILKYLPKGVDINRPYSREMGNTPLMRAIYNTYEGQDTVVRLFMYYGANPLIRNNEGENPLDNALSSGHDTLYKIMISFLMKKSSVIFKIKDLPVVKNIDVIPGDHAVTTKIHFNDFTITTDLKPTNRFSPEVLDHVLFPLFSHYFNNPKKNMKEVFREEIKDNNTLIELIYDKEEPIGFNIFKLIHLKKFKDNLTLHPVYSAIHPQYRRLGLMSFLGFRIAHALPFIYDGHLASVFFSAIHYNSFKAILDFLCFPKYQSESVKKYVKALLKEIYDTVEYYNDGISCYIKEDDVVNEPPVDEFLYVWLLGYLNKNVTLDKSRAIPCFFYVDDVSINLLSYILSLLNIHFREHIENLADAMRFASCLDILPLKENPTKNPLIPVSEYRFFKGEGKSRVEDTPKKVSEPKKHSEKPIFKL